MKRVDLATTIHKAVRRLLFEQAMLFGRCDLAIDTERDEALDGLVKVLTLLREHAEHEDEVIVPLFSGREPELLAEFERQHASLERAIRELERLAATLRTVTASERADFGARLSHRFQSFVAEQLAHLVFEETAGNAALWRHFDDAELCLARERILSRVVPAHAASWFNLVRASANASELAELGGLAVGQARSA